MLRMKTGPFVALALLATAFLASACNTMEGLGQDTQAAGEALEDEASE